MCHCSSLPLDGAVWSQRSIMKQRSDPPRTRSFSEMRVSLGLPILSVSIPRTKMPLRLVLAFAILQFPDLPMGSTPPRGLRSPRSTRNLTIGLLALPIRKPTFSYARGPFKGDLFILGWFRVIYFFLWHRDDLRTSPQWVNRNGEKTKQISPLGTF